MQSLKWIPFTILGLASLSFFACTPEVPQGSGHRSEMSRSLPLFTEVEVRGPIEVNLRFPDEKSGVRRKKTPVRISGDSNLIPMVYTRIKNGRFFIDTEGVEIKPKMGIFVEATPEELHSITLREDARLNLRGTKNPELKIEGHDASYFRLSNIRNERLLLEGHDEVKGRVEGIIQRLDIFGTHKAQFETHRLSADKVYLRLSGDTVVTVCARHLLNVEASGNAKVIMFCDPKVIEKELSGNANIRGASRQEFIDNK